MSFYGKIFNILQNALNTIQTRYEDNAGVEHTSQYTITGDNGALSFESGDQVLQPTIITNHSGNQEVRVIYSHKQQDGADSQPMLIDGIGNDGVTYLGITTPIYDDYGHASGKKNIPILGFKDDGAGNVSIKAPAAEEGDNILWIGQDYYIQS